MLVKIFLSSHNVAIRSHNVLSEYYAVALKPISSDIEIFQDLGKIFRPAHTRGMCLAKYHIRDRWLKPVALVCGQPAIMLIRGM